MMVSRDLLVKAELQSLDEDLGGFMMDLLMGIVRFDHTFFHFFQCKDKQLIKQQGDKAYNQFLEICLQDLFDQSKLFIEASQKLNPFTLVTIASVS